MSLTSILAIVQTVMSVALTLLTGNNVISSEASSLISGLVEDAVSIIGGLIANKGTATAEILVAIQGMQSTLATLKADTSLPPAVLNDITVLSDAVAAAVAEDAVASKTVDPSTLTPIDPL